MTSTDDYPGEMPVLPRIDDATAEELLAGRPLPPDLDQVATVVRALRDVTEQPVTPSPELATRMATGDFAANGSAAAARPPVRRWELRALSTAAGRRRPLRLGGRLAAAGLAAGLVGVGTAGFAGSLPEPVQDGFETVVESVSPYRFEGAADGRQGEQPGRPDEGRVPPGDEQPDGAPGDGPEGRPGEPDGAELPDSEVGGADAPGRGDGRPAPPPGEQPGPPGGSSGQPDEGPGPAGPPGGQSSGSNGQDPGVRGQHPGAGSEHGQPGQGGPSRRDRGPGEVHPPAKGGDGSQGRGSDRGQGSGDGNSRGSGEGRAQGSGDDRPGESPGAGQEPPAGPDQPAVDGAGRDGADLAGADSDGEE